MEQLMIKKIHQNYVAFYNMVLATTLLSNASSDAFDEDATKIIDFIGQAYRLDEDLIAYAKRCILDDLVAISTRADVTAFVNSHTFDSEVDELDSLFSIKADVIESIEAMRERRDINLSTSWFDYSHYKPYYPEIRFEQLLAYAAIGNPIANKEVGILLFLGIGKAQNIPSAILRLKQCMMWGDLSVIPLLREMAKESNDEEEHVFEELTLLMPYMQEGRTIVPKELEEKLSKESKELFVLITSIKQDIVIEVKDLYINQSFVEVMLLKDLNYYRKLYFINNYRSNEWKNATNSSNDPNSRIGFKIGE